MSSAHCIYSATGEIICLPLASSSDVKIRNVTPSLSQKRETFIVQEEESFTNDMSTIWKSLPTSQLVQNSATLE